MCFAFSGNLRFLCSPFLGTSELVLNAVVDFLHLIYMRGFSVMQNLHHLDPFIYGVDILPDSQFDTILCGANLILRPYTLPVYLVALLLSICKKYDW